MKRPSIPPFPFCCFTLLLIALAIPGAAEARRREQPDRDLARIERLLSHRHLVAFDLAPLPFPAGDAALPPDDTGRTVALVRTMREPGGADWKPADPLFDTLAILERGALRVERIGPFRRSAVRVEDLDRDGAFEAMIAPLPERSTGRADLFFLDRIGGATVLHRIAARGFDEYALARDPETGLFLLSHRFLETPRAERKREVRYGYTRFGPKPVDEPVPPAPPLHPVAEDAWRAAGERPWIRIASRDHLVTGRRAWRGPERFSFAYRIDRGPSELIVEVRVRDERLDPRPNEGDRVTLALAGYAASRAPGLITLRPHPVRGVSSDILPDGARLDPLPVDDGYGFRLALPGAHLAALGIRTDDPALLFRLEARTCEGPGLEAHAQLLSTNGRTGAARADLSVLATDTNR